MDKLQLWWLLNKVLPDEQQIKRREMWGLSGEAAGEAIAWDNHVNEVLMWECGHCVKRDMKMSSFPEMGIYKSKE